MKITTSSGIVCILGGSTAFGFWMHNWVAGVFMACALTIFDSLKLGSKSRALSTPRQASPTLCSPMSSSGFGHLAHFRFQKKAASSLYAGPHPEPMD
jgi:hypothetical protein